MLGLGKSKHVSFNLGNLRKKSNLILNEAWNEERNKNHSLKTEKKITKKINKTKAQIFEKISQTDNHVDRLTRRSKNIQIINTKMREELLPEISGTRNVWEEGVPLGMLACVIYEHSIEGWWECINSFQNTNWAYMMYDDIIWVGLCSSQ